MVSSNYDSYQGFLFPVLDQRNPMIISITDVPADQGHQVQIVWEKCGFDDGFGIVTLSYSLWRLDENFSQMMTSYKAKTESFKKSQKLALKPAIANSNYENIYTNPSLIIELSRKNPDKTYYWQKNGHIWTFIAEIPALNYDEYAYVAPTLLDSSVVDTNCSTFKIIYHDLYASYESEPDSGYSIDNIPPDSTKVNIAKNGNNMRLTWDEVEYGTFQGNSYPELNGIWYKIYAGNEPEFSCNQSSHLVTVTNLHYDFSLSGIDKKFFKIVVSDKP